MFDFLNFTPTWLISLFGFVVTISFLVAIHEYGHFWVARKFGVKIEKFSIGFGKPIIKWYGKKDHTEYSVSWIPLGGYVKMYGETPKDLKITNNKIKDSREANSQPAHDISDLTNAGGSGHSGSFSELAPIKRFLIALAGPAVNLIFALLVLWFLFILGVPAIKPYIGSIEKNSIFASAQIQSGSQITAINGSPIQTLSNSIMYLIDSIGNPKTQITTVDKNNTKNTATIDLSHLAKGSEFNIEKALGFSWEITEVAKNLPAKIKTVVVNSPADKAGIKNGDTVVQINDHAIENWQSFVKDVTTHPEQTIDIIVERNGTTKQLSLTPQKHPKIPEIGYAGVYPDVSETLYDKYRGVKKFGLLASLPMSVKENYLQAKLTLKILGRMIIGNASIKNVGGPITIADYSGRSLQMGYVAYLKFLAAISLTLAVMNLLPIPVLDGGHMTLCTIEIIRGKPISERSSEILLRFGMSIILAFMVAVMAIDFWKYLLH